MSEENAYQLFFDQNGIIVSAQYTNTREGQVVSKELYNQAREQLGACRLDSGKLVSIVVAKPAVVPGSVARWQFIQVLAKDGKITEDEALAWIGGTGLPATLVGAIEQLPAAVRFPVKVKLLGASDFYRQNEYVSVLGQLLGYTDAAFDDIWTRGNQL